MADEEAPRRPPGGGMPSPFEPQPPALPGAAMPAAGSGPDLLAAELADRQAEEAAQVAARAQMLTAARAARAALLSQAAQALPRGGDIFPPLPPTLSPGPTLPVPFALSSPSPSPAEAEAAWPPPPRSPPAGAVAPPLASPALEPLLDEATVTSSASFEDAHRLSFGAAPTMAPAPWPGDRLSPARRGPLLRLAAAGLLLGMGTLLGVQLAPDGPRELRVALQAAEHQLQADRSRLAALEQAIGDQVGGVGRGKLSVADRTRHLRALHRYMNTLRRVQAQGAAELMQWFVGRWNQLLDAPQEDDRTGRRAAALALLVGGMAENLNEGDFVPWQAEFLNGDWLGELHFDMDGDGLPGKRSAANRHDGFANVSVCHIAMALNQSMTDARVLVRPDMRCDRTEARMSVFLQGKTFDDALSEFVRAVREQGFLVAERVEKGTRLVLVGARPPSPARD